MMTMLMAIALLQIFFRANPGFLPVLFACLIVFGFSLTFVVLGGYGKSRLFWGKSEKAKEILNSGSSGMATVKSIGNYYKFVKIKTNQQPEVKLTLSIEPEKKSSYDLTLHLIIPEYAIPRFQPGTAFAVKIDKSNPKSVVYAR